MSWLENKYINLLSSRLESFSRVGTDTYKFRCPICGDSTKDKKKTRGYVFQRGGNLRYFCHNCGASMRIQRFIKAVDPNLYLEFIKEKLKEQGQVNETHEFAQKMKKPVFVKTTALKDLKKVSQLQHDHPVKLYVEKRMIPPELHHKLFYSPKFASWTNSMIPDKFNDKVENEPRLIIPFLDKDKQLFGYQGRSFKKNGLRYITIMLNEEMPKIFGLDGINPDKDIYLLEGPIDSMFIPNAIAAAGGDLISQIKLTNFKKDNIVVVYDNEPRNADVVKKVQKAIEDGYRVCIWPTTMQQKDVNDMILAGYTPEQVKDIIDECTYTGPTGKLHLAIWRKDR